MALEILARYEQACLAAGCRRRRRSRHPARWHRHGAPELAARSPPRSAGWRSARSSQWVQYARAQLSSVAASPDATAMSLLELRGVGQRYRDGQLERVALRESPSTSTPANWRWSGVCAAPGARRCCASQPGSRRPTPAWCASKGAISHATARSCSAPGSATARRRSRGERLADRARAGDAVAARARHLPRPKARPRAREALERAGAVERCAARACRRARRRRDRCASRSPGCSRSEPRLLVIDDPVGGVDLLERDGILLLLRSFADEASPCSRAPATRPGCPAPTARSQLSEGAAARPEPARSSRPCCRCAAPAGGGKPAREHARAGGRRQALPRGGEEVRAVDGVSLTVPARRDGRRAGAVGLRQDDAAAADRGAAADPSTARSASPDEISALSEDEASDYLMRDVGFIYQSYRLMPKVSALENASLKLLLAGVGLREAKQQRVAVARAPRARRPARRTRPSSSPAASASGSRSRGARGRAAADPRR